MSEKADGTVAMGVIAYATGRCSQCQQKIAIPYMDLIGHAEGIIPALITRWCHPGETAVDGLQRADAEVERLRKQLKARTIVGVREWSDAY